MYLRWAKNCSHIDITYLNDWQFWKIPPPRTNSERIKFCCKTLSRCIACRLFSHQNIPPRLTDEHESWWKLKKLHRAHVRDYELTCVRDLLALPICQITKASDRFNPVTIAFIRTLCIECFPNESIFITSRTPLWFGVSHLLFSVAGEIPCWPSHLCRMGYQCAVSGTADCVHLRLSECDIIKNRALLSKAVKGGASYVVGEAAVPPRRILWSCISTCFCVIEHLNVYLTRVGPGDSLRFLSWHTCSYIFSAHVIKNWPRSLKVRSPGHVKWPHLRKSLNARQSYTDLPIALKLLAINIPNNIYKMYIWEFLYQWPKFTDIKSQFCIISQWKNWKAPVLAESHSKHFQTSV